MANLPSEYKELLYLKSTGTQYIDTDYKHKNKTFIKMSVLIPSTSTSWFVFGSRDWAGHNSLILWHSDTNKLTLMMDYTDPTLSFQLDQKIDIEFDRTHFKIDDEETTFINDISTPTVNEILFGFQDMSGSVGPVDSMTVYSFQVLENGVLVRDMIPALRLSDNKPGMYDLANDVFYTNGGTGEFEYVEACEVAINSQGLGTISGITSGLYEKGKEVTINATPGEGYRLQSLTINGEEVEELPYTFTIEENITIQAIFTRIPTYDVSIIINGRGNVNGIEPGTYIENTSMTITSVTPNFGYTLVECKINGTKVYDFPHTFTLTQNVIVEATFDNLYYFITDRTQQDVNYVKELNNKMLLGTATEEEEIDWNIIKKGALNRGDLQRLLGALNFITEYIGGNIVTTSVPEFPTAEWYDTFVTDIKNTVHSWYSAMIMPNSPYNTYEKWNEIENAVKTLYNIVINLMWYYCSSDDLYCADSIII